MRFIIAVSLLLGSQLAMANCSTEQTLCETKCSVMYLTDDAAELGCKSKCVAKRALCSTESGAETAVETGEDVIDSGVEVTKEAWQDTKSFVKGLTE